MGIRIDIKEKDLKILLAMLQQFLPNTLVWAFGSRVKFTAKPTSDLDLVAFISEAQKMNFSLLKDALAESDLPFRVDLHDWNEIPENFKKNIEGSCIVIQDRNETALPNNWKAYKLGDLGSFFGGVTTISKDDYGHGTPFLPYKNVYKNSKVNVNELELMNVRPQDVERRSAVFGDIFFTASSETPDEVAMSSVLLDNVENLTFNGFCKRFRLNDFKTLLPEYARYLFRDISFRREVYQLATGDIRFNISQDSLAKIEITIPDIPTQTQIAQILTSLDNKIELNLQMNQTLEAMAKAIFKEWFVDFKFPGFDGELVDGLPKGWRECSMKDFGKIICGKTPSKAIDEYFGGEYMFIKIPDMHNSVFIIETTDSLTDLGLNSQSNKTIPPYSICISSIATVGLVCINPKACQTNQQINSIVPNNMYLRYFLYFLTTLMKETFLATASGGTATLNMNTSQFSNIGAFMPNDDILKKFDEVVSPIMEKILENEYNIKSLTQTRDSLLPRLMSGKIEV